MRYNTIIPFFKRINIVYNSTGNNVFLWWHFILVKKIVFLKISLTENEATLRHCKQKEKKKNDSFINM